MRVGETIYLDYQAATPTDPRVRQKMFDADSALFANPHATDHILGWKASTAIEQSARTIAEYFGMAGNELIFTSGASEANTMAILAAAQFAAADARSEIVVCAGDHSSILNEATQSYLLLKICPIDANGHPNLDWLNRQVNAQTALVSVVGVNNENGAIANLDAISQICRHAGCLFHADLAQAPTAIDVDLAEVGISLATLSSHKIYGPKGMGALLASPDAFEWLKPIILGGGQQNGLRGGTVPTDLCVGFAAAVDILTTEAIIERDRIHALRDRMVQKIEDSKLGRLIGTLDNRHPGNALIHFPGIEASDLLGRLQPRIAASSQSACSSGTIEPSRVIQAMGYDRSTASQCIRFSLGRFTDETQIDEAIECLAAAIEEVRR